MVLDSGPEQGPSSVSDCCGRDRTTSACESMGGGFVYRHLRWAGSLPSRPQTGPEHSGTFAIGTTPGKSETVSRRPLVNGGHRPSYRASQGDDFRRPGPLLGFAGPSGPVATAALVGGIYNYGARSEEVRK